jgi:putative ABC transport system substrate-binding protein
MKGDIKAAEEAARNLEQEKVNLIFTTQTSVTIAAKRATADIPIVFRAGSDPVVLGLVESFAKPGGRLTGFYYRGTDLTAKRLEILKEIVPKLRRVVTFYDPRNPVAIESAKFAREEAARLRGVELVERHIASVEELQAGVRKLRAGEVDAYFELSDPMVIIQDQLIIDTAGVKKLPTMFQNQSSVIKGGLASYSVSRPTKWASAHVQRTLLVLNPHFGIDRLIVINRQADRLTMPQWTPMKADKVIR